ncbi:MAG: hypothetical protein HY319_20760 [Armatimonadetes bacterium]|nr:hypothetical protein [Armatimonadota bacterium]
MTFAFPGMTVLVLDKTHLGSVPVGEEAFGQQMLDRFLHTMEPEPLRPAVACLYTDGVRLACHGSPVLLGLELLAGLGMKILVCQTCLEHFGLRDRLAVGEVVTMKDIVATLASATRTLSI